MKNRKSILFVFWIGILIVAYSIYKGICTGDAVNLFGFAFGVFLLVVSLIMDETKKRNYED